MDDLQFVRRCVKGDKRAWDEFIERYSRLIYNYIHRAINAKSHPQFNQDYAADLFQEIFVLLSGDNFKKLKTFRAKNGCSLASWLRQVTVNYTLDYLRKSKSMVSLDAENKDDEHTLKDILAHDGPQALDTLLLEERIAHLKDCIKGLDTDDKYFLELYLNQGIAPEELKVLFKVSRSAVDMRKFRIIERLKDCFRSKGFALDF